jgi:hypothetical protein
MQLWLYKNGRDEELGSMQLAEKLDWKGLMHIMQRDGF